jgi:hypothetical protein
VSVQDQLREALHRVDAYEPSPDLFWRVQRSIEEDRAHRRRIRLAVGLVAVSLVAVGVYVSVFLEVIDGEATMPWWSLEILTVAVMVALVLVLGPLVRRFGALYAGAVFSAHPPTSRRFLALLDIAYYLIFSALILMSTSVEPRREWLRADGLAQQLEWSTERIGVLLILMGILHSLTLVALPVIGLVFSTGWRKERPGL